MRNRRQFDKYAQERRRDAKDWRSFVKSWRRRRKDAVRLSPFWRRAVLRENLKERSDAIAAP